MGAPPAGPLPEASPAVPQPRRYSRGGLIAASIMTGWCLIGFVVNWGHGGASWFACLVANAALFWRSFRPPLRFGQGVAVWFGGLIAGTAVTVFGLPLLPAIGAFVIFVAMGAGLIRLGMNPPPRGGAKIGIGIAVALIVLSLLAAAFYSLRGRKSSPAVAPAATQPR